jgi:hypothetical protein
MRRQARVEENICKYKEFQNHTKTNDENFRSVQKTWPLYQLSYANGKYANLLNIVNH